MWSSFILATKSVANQNLDIYLPILTSGLFPLRQMCVSPVCATLGQPHLPTSSCLPLTDAAEAKESSREARKRNGHVDRTEGTSSFTGVSPDSRVWSEH